METAKGFGCMSVIQPSVVCEQSAAVLVIVIQRGPCVVECSRCRYQGTVRSVTAEGLERNLERNTQFSVSEVSLCLDSYIVRKRLCGHLQLLD